METLSRLFGSEIKVKIMRLFLFSPEKVFSFKEIALRTKGSASQVRKEVLSMEKIGLVKRRSIKPQRHGFVLNKEFGYLLPLQNFLINLEPLHPKEIIRRISRLGVMKLIVVSGVFIQEPESRLDLLIVGDGVKRAALENMMKTLESEIGKELRYSYFTTSDFNYRLSMFDKLIRDVLDYPHRKVLNRLGIL